MEVGHGGEDATQEFAHFFFAIERTTRNHIVSRCTRESGKRCLEIATIFRFLVSADDCLAFLSKIWIYYRHFARFSVRFSLKVLFLSSILGDSGALRGGFAICSWPRSIRSFPLATTY